MATLQVDVVAVERTIWSGEARMVIARTTEGELGVLPGPGAADWRPPAFRPDGADPNTVHLEGLLVSRAWCLDAIGRALPPSHPVAPTALAAGTQGAPPASVTLLGGDVHHSYLAEVSLPAGTTSGTAVYQLVCSPIHNLLPDNFRQLQRIVTSRAGEVIGGTLARLARVPRPQLGWRITRGPWFPNMLAALDFDGRHTRVRFDRSTPDPTQSPHLVPVDQTDLS